MLGMDCRSCGVSLEATGRPGRPFERCEACREKCYSFETCQFCGEPLPEDRNKQSGFCNKKCQNSAWKAADRASKRVFCDPDGILRRR